MAEAWVTTYRRIEEQVVPGKRLGRHVAHDSRNRLYPWQRSTATLVSKMWSRSIGILDQGNLGSCTGNAQVGALGSDPDYTALPVGHLPLDEALAVAIYSSAERIDGGAGYPPEDEGSTGPSAARAAKDMGLISGYLHCFGLTDVLDALQQHPVCLGTSWYEGMDSPDSSGLVTISGSIRGGHEYLCRGLDVGRRLVFLDNSWGTGWGKDGSFSYSWDTLDRLLHEQGDGTVSLPLTTPAPQPVPVPPQPAPHPGPDDADLALFRETRAWAAEKHAGQARAVAGDLRRWYQEKGFS